MTSFDDLVQEVIDHEFSESRYSAFARKQLVRAQRVLAAEINFRELEAGFSFTAANGFSSVALPDDFDRLHSLVRSDSGNNWHPMEFLRKAEFAVQRSATPGVPWAYSVESSVILLTPVPAAPVDFQLTYYRMPQVVSGTVNPEIPEEARHLMVDWALARCYARENDYRSAEYHQQVFDLAKEKIKGQAHYDGQDRTQPRIVGQDNALGDI